MNLTKYLLSLYSESKAIFGDQASQIPSSQLKLQFQDILVNPKYPIGADQFTKRLNNSTSLSASATDSSSMTLHYEDYKGQHALFSEEDIKTLRRISEILSSRNELADCVQMYVERRKDTVNTVCMSLRKKLNLETVCVFNCLDELSDKIRGWIQVAKICIAFIFIAEKCFYEQIFGDLETLEDTAANGGFASIVAGATAELFDIPDSLLASRRVPQRPDILLPLCQELTNLVPQLIACFDQDGHLAKATCGRVTEILLRLKQQMTKILSVTEKHVLRELSTRPFPGGGIHPLTEHIIHHIDLIYLHRKSLADLVARPQGSKDRDTPEALGSHEMDERPICLNGHLTRIIEFLLYNLKFKSNFYGQESLGYLFMMNNANSVSEMINTCEKLGELLGTHLRMKLREKVELERNDYLHTSWGEVYNFLKGKGLKSHLTFDFFPGSSTRAVKKKLKTFNRMFEDILQTQEGWVVPDQQLRMKLLECIVVKLIPAYNHFLGQLSRVHKVKDLNGCIKYSVTDLEAKVLNMFQNRC